MNMPKATQLCFFGLALILMPLVVSYSFALIDAKTVHKPLTANQHLTTTTLGGAARADLLMATTVEVEELTSSIPPVTTTYITSGTDVDFNQRITGLLSHVYWLIDRASLGGGRTSTSGGVNRELFDKQIERSADNANDSIRDTRSELSGDISDLDTRLASAEADLANLSIAAASTSVMAANLTLNGHWVSGDGDDEGVFVDASGNVGIGTSTPSSRLSVVGDLYLTGALRDGLNSAGTAGMVLQSTGGSTRWVATSTLGITGGGGGVTTFLALTDTVGSYTANRIMFTNSGGTALTDSANFVFTGTNLGIGTTTPSTALSVVGDTTLDGDLTINNNVLIGGTIQAPLLTPGRVLYSTTGSYLTDSANFVFTGTNLGVGTSTPGSRLTVVGDAYITGALRDGLNASGTQGMVLQSTGTSTRWVATSTLGITGGGGATTFLALTDTISSFTANRILYTSGSAVVDSANFTYDGTDLGLGADNGIAINGTRVLTASTTANNYVFGRLAGLDFTSGAANILIGSEAGRRITTAAGNVLIGGTFTGSSLTTGGSNTFVGDRIGSNLTTADSNTFMGNDTAFELRSGGDNTFIGKSAGRDLATSTESVLIGRSAGSGNGQYTANRLTLVGVRAGDDLTTGADNNVFFGYNAGANVTTGANNLLFGYQVADNLTTGANNLVIGYDVDIASTTGSNQLNIGNVIFGTDIDGTGTTLSTGNIGIGTTTAGSKLTIDGDLRVYGGINFGAETIISNSDGNALFGSFALGNNVDGYRTIAIGDLAGNSFNTGFSNVFIGNDAANNLSTTSGSVVIGDLAVGANYGGTSGGDMVVIGTRAGYRIESGGNNGVLIGAFAGENVTTGGGNILMGYRAGDNITDGYGNIVIGYEIDTPSASAFQTLNIGNLLFGTGIDGTGTTTSSGNIGIGTSTPVSKLSVIGDVSIGAGPYYSQSRPLKIYDDGNTGGARVSVIGTTGVSNTPAIEFVLDGLLSRRSMIRMTNEGSSDYGLDFLTTNNGTVASKVVLTGDGNFGIGTTTPSEELTVVGTIQATNLFGGTTNLVTDANGNIIRDTSDERLKENVTTIENALDTVLALRGVRYKWIDKERFGDNFEIGFLAQEVDEVVPEVVQKGGDYWALNSKNLVAVVVEAIKEVWAKVLGHEERLDELEAENEALKARLESVERELDIDDVPDTIPPPVVEVEPEEVDPTPEESETGEEPAEDVVEEQEQEEDIVTEPETGTEPEPKPEVEEDVEESEPKDAPEEPVTEDALAGEGE